MQEYVVWQVWEKRLDWYELNEDGEYVARQPDERGVIESRAFSELRLAVEKLLADDLSAVLAEQNREL